MCVRLSFDESAIFKSRDTKFDKESLCTSKPSVDQVNFTFN